MSATKHTSFIPMSPELLPRQKLNEVVTIPELTDVFSSIGESVGTKTVVKKSCGRASRQRKTCRSTKNECQ